LKKKERPFERKEQVLVAFLVGEKEEEGLSRTTDRPRTTWEEEEEGGAERRMIRS